MSGASDRRGLTIGAVQRALQDEFPDISISKLRYLDGKKLVSPQRRGSGYREYSERDVERLRFVLRAQRDRFWPLEVIREALDAFDRGLEPDLGESGRPVVPAPEHDPDRPDPEALAAPAPQLRLTAKELRQNAGLSEAQLSELRSFRLVQPSDDGLYDAHDLSVARAAAELAGHGVQGRHLRPFRLAADREIGIVEQAGAGDPERRAEVLACCLQLHLALVRSALEEGATTPPADR